MDVKKLLKPTPIFPRSSSRRGSRPLLVRLYPLFEFRDSENKTGKAGTWASPTVPAKPRTPHTEGSMAGDFVQAVIRYTGTLVADGPIPAIRWTTIEPRSRGGFRMPASPELCGRIGAGVRKPSKNEPAGAEEWVAVYGDLTVLRLRRGAG